MVALSLKVRWVLLVASGLLAGALAQGCAATIDGRRGPLDATLPEDATPTKDATPTEDARVDVAREDVPAPDVSSPRVILRVRVMVGPLDPPSFGEGFRVRAQGVSGEAVEASTDAMGFVALAVLPELAPYDVTVARANFTAVSVMGVPAPYGLEMYVRSASLERPMGVTTRRVTGAISGLRSPMNTVVLQGFAGTQVTRQGRYEMGFETWSGAPPLLPVALEYDPAMRLVNAVAATPIERGDTDITVDFAFPTPPASVESVNLGVEFPFVGLVTPGSFDAVQSQGVIRQVASSIGPTSLYLGISDLQPPSPMGVARWHLDSLSGDLAPELFWASWTHRGPQPLRASVGLQPPFRGLRPSLGVVDQLSVVDSATETLLTARATRYDHAMFEVRSTNAMIQGRWTGFTFRGAEVARRSLPSLPSGVTVSSLFSGTSTAQTRVLGCVLRRLPTGPVPWASPSQSVIFDSEVSVCTTEGPALLGR